MDSLIIVLLAAIALTIVLLLVQIALTLKNRKENVESISDASFYKYKEELRDTLRSDISELSDKLTGRIDQISARLDQQAVKSTELISSLQRENRAFLKDIDQSLSSFVLAFKDFEIKSQRESAEAFERVRLSITDSLKAISERTEQLTNQVRFDMDKIREDNNKRLEEMRATVDEKLQSSINERITASFKEVKENLVRLYESIGSLNKLTSDVQNINKVFSNVKTRGEWGEVQAESILSDILAADQYVTNYSPREGSSEKVEFAVRLPGKNGRGDVYLPIDSKFPTSAFLSYREAVDSHDESAISSSIAQLKLAIKKQAKTIQQKYIYPPNTTDFAILFLPSESLYAELQRLPELVAELQRDNRVIISGPNNFAALLNSLRLGFKTFQIERYTAQLWNSFLDMKRQFTRLAKAIDDSKTSGSTLNKKLDDAKKIKEQLLEAFEKIEDTSRVEADVEYLEES